MNAVAEGLTGWTLSEASQKPVKQVFKIINEHTRLAVEDPISKVLETGMIAGLANHTLLIRKDGTEVAIDDSGAPIKDETGKITGVVLVFRDISERRQTEEALRQSHSSLSGINQILHAGLTRQTEAELGRACLEIAEKITQSRFGFISEKNKDGCGSIAISNPGWEACNILDAGGHRVTGGSFKIHGIYGRVMSDGKPLLTNEPANHPDRVGLPAGHPPLESFLGVPLIREGRAIGMIAVANRPGGYTPAEQKTLEALEPAIVEAFVRKRMEEALRESRDDLEMRVQERTAQLEFLNQALKAENEERLKVEIELRESEIRLRQLSAELLHTQEKERRLFAQDLHDSIGSSLAAIKFKVEAALSQTGNQGLQPEAALKSVIPAIQTAIHETRRIQKALRPPVLDDLGILATIRWFCREYESTYSAIRIKQEIDIKEEEVADSLKIIIFRVLQEALNNIAKHSGAELARLSLRKAQGRIELVLEDDGQGFDLKKVLGSESTRRGLGLTSMSERTELSGGYFSIDSVMGKGTVIRAVWPL
jgi:PAS domain S-box-containing protein